MKWGCLSVFVLALVFYSVLHVVAWVWATAKLPQNIRGMNYTAFQTFIHDEEPIPERFFTAPPYDPALQEQAGKAGNALQREVQNWKRYDDLWSLYERLNALNLGLSLKSGEWTDMQSKFEAFAEPLREWKECSRLLREKVQMGIEPDNLPEIPFGHEFVVPLFCFQAERQKCDGQWSEALQTAFDGLYLTTHVSETEYDCLMRLIDEQTSNLHYSVSLAVECLDAELLRPRLRELIALEPYLFPKPDPDFPTLLLLQDFQREVQRANQVDWESNLTREKCVSLILDHRTQGISWGTFATHILGRFARYTIENDLQYIGRRVLLVHRLDELIVSQDLWQGWDFSTEQLQVAKFYYDMALLALAAKLYWNDRGTLPAAQTDLIPDYLQKERTDPFSGGTYVWLANERRFGVSGAVPRAPYSGYTLDVKGLNVSESNEGDGNEEAIE